MRVRGLAVAGMLALTAPIAGHATALGPSTKQLVPAPGIVKVWGGCGWGWQAGARSLEPVERRMGSTAMRAEPFLWLVGSRWELGSL